MNTYSNAAASDYSAPDIIDDTIASLKFFPNPQDSILASCGWDGKVRLWTLRNQGSQIQSTLNTTIQCDNPLLSLCWQGTSPNLLTSSTDGFIAHIDVTKGQKNLLGKHDSGCKELVYLPKLNVLLSGGWDGKLHIWDFRSNNPVMSCTLNQKIYTMSTAENLLVVGLSDRVVCYFDLSKLQLNQFQPVASFESHLKYQTRKVSCFPQGDGYAIGSIEGRVAIKYINLNIPPKLENNKTMTTQSDFSYKCHQTNSAPPEVYPINDIAFNPKHGTFATIGGDGFFIMWDKDSRSRLAQGQVMDKCPLTACDYSWNGDLFAYAAGYDWEKGIGGDGQFKPQLRIHYCTDIEKLKKKK